MPALGPVVIGAIAVFALVLVSLVVQGRRAARTRQSQRDDLGLMRVAIPDPALTAAILSAFPAGVSAPEFALAGLERVTTGEPGAWYVAMLKASAPAASAADATISRLGPGTTWGEALSRSDVVVSRIDAARATREIAATLPRDARLLAIGETRLGLMPRATEIATAVDAPLLGDVLQGCTSIADVNARLSGRVTHVLVNYRELERHQRSYGFTERLGPEKLQLMREWLAQADLLGTWGNTSLYEVPSKR